ncbi:MAG: lipoate--protein ligase family protein [Acidiferrobacterales bacterium]
MRHHPPAQARFIDLGTLSPDALHAAYCGLAAVQDEDAEPILIWARSAAPHMCIGQSQSARYELDIEACAQAGVAIVRRPIGGGTVLVDADQYCVFFILPRLLAAARPSRVFEYCLAPMARTFRQFGISARVVGRTDLWCEDVKIAGSGAATVGRTIVFGSSFVLRFPYALFASLVRAPSVDFRLWLRDALPAVFVPWQELAALPSGEALAQAMQAAVGEVLGWSVRASALSPAEIGAMHEAEDELRLDMADDDDTHRRRVTHGIKLNAATYLTELQDASGWLRVLLKDNAIARIAADDPLETAVLTTCIGSSAQPAALRSRLERAFGVEQASVWVARIARAIEGTQGDDGFNEGTE